MPALRTFVLAVLCLSTSFAFTAAEEAGFMIAASLLLNLDETLNHE